MRRMTISDRENERFNDLRLKEVGGTLSEAEQVELAAIMQTRLQASDEFLDVVVARVRQTHDNLQQRLSHYQAESEALATLLLQQEQLVSDATQWLTEFDRRNQHIQQIYTQLTGETLLPA
ncbi:MAG TPA: hypothetical protein ENJ56_07950 [Anaerolineae bacterium]|nr:hypothetical protein [Anaerolineae bacterium]